MPVEHTSDTAPSGPLHNKVAIVTGSTYGIGFCIARRLAKDGAKVVISSRNKANVEKALDELRSLYPDQIAGIVCHVGNAEDRDRLITYTLETFGKINLFVSNAAVNPHVGNLLEIQESQWDKIFDVNLKSTFMLCQKVIPHMLKNEEEDKGSVIIISSAVAYAGLPGIGAYAISKTALLGLCKNLSGEVAKHGIRVNLVAPGLIETRFSEVLWKQTGGDKLHHSTHLKRLGNQDEISGTVSFLCGPDSSYITGENIVVSGGYHCTL